MDPDPIHQSLTDRHDEVSTIGLPRQQKEMDPCISYFDLFSSPVLTVQEMQPQGRLAIAYSSVLDPLINYR